MRWNFAGERSARDSPPQKRHPSTRDGSVAFKDQPHIFVIDDDASILTWLIMLFKSRGFQADGFRTAGEFLAFRRPFGPACLVLEAGLPDGGGLDLQRRLAAADIDLPIVFMARRPDVQMAIGALKAGALDFLLKPLQESELLDAVLRALKHDAAAIRQRAELAELQSRHSRLTPREREVLVGIVSGRLNKQVASELAVSEGTVKVYRRRLMKKMQAASLTDLVRMTDRLATGATPEFQGLNGEYLRRSDRQAQR